MSHQFLEIIKSCDIILFKFLAYLGTYSALNALIGYHLIAFIDYHLKVYHPIVLIGFYSTLNAPINYHLNALIGHHLNILINYHLNALIGHHLKLNRSLPKVQRENALIPIVMP
jgi:hypothetical protein